jgi:hypothetical protein
MSETKCFDEGKPELLFTYWLGLSPIYNEPKGDLLSSFSRYIDCFIEEDYEAVIDYSYTLIQYTARSLGLEEISILTMVSEVSKFGANKYGLNNYIHGTQVSRRLNSASRHLLKYMIGNKVYDEESGLHHLAHFIANILIINSWVNDEEKMNKFNDMVQYKTND